MYNSNVSYINVIIILWNNTIKITFLLYYILKRYIFKLFMQVEFSFIEFYSY